MGRFTDPHPLTCSFFTPPFCCSMLELCALPSVLSKLVQRRKILFSTEAIPDFNALPLQARLGLLFFFCLSFARQPYLTLLWEDVFPLTQVCQCPWIRPQLPHTAPTGRGTGFTGVVSPTRLSKPHIALHRASCGFLCPKTRLPLPLKGEGLGFAQLGVLRFSGFAHNCPTRFQRREFGALLVLLPYLVLKTGHRATQGQVWISPFFLGVLWVW